MLPDWIHNRIDIEQYLAWSTVVSAVLLVSVGVLVSVVVSVCGKAATAGFSVAGAGDWDEGGSA